MHFNIYLDDETGKRLNALAEKAGESRNALIRRAVTTLLESQERPKWPKIVQEFRGMPDFPAFEENRNELLAPSADPLA